MKGKLAEHEIQNLLLSQVMGRMACSDEHQPYIVPLTYTYDGEYIYGQISEGTKLTILRKNPRICFEVDMMKDMVNWQSVIVYGTFEELQNEAADAARNILYDRVLFLVTSTTMDKCKAEEKEETFDNEPLNHFMYRIKILETSGRFETV